MTVVLAPMSPDAFVAFKEAAIVGYAEDSVRAGRWAEGEALECAREEFGRLLPQGTATPGHRLFEVREGEAGAVLGQLWFGTVGSSGERTGYLYNIRIEPQHRGRGHAKAALDALERLARAEGLAGIALHVFATNTTAQALYRSQGYGITGLNMRKRLRADGRKGTA